ncbi:MAG: type I DNA topoisomerase, partial [Bacilli bacterium]|nr:type I DNA topoisomerase [Bacilli bacterium]
VSSSKGHIRNLKNSGYKRFGVDIENNFQAQYRILKDKKDVVAELTKEVKKAEKIYLATDPDREGEAISWHLFETLDLGKKEVERIVFHEITKTAVLHALENGRSIDMDLVKSQEARLILDKIIGFSLSSLLQKKIGSKSAGRVQSVALKLIVDKEKEIEAFTPEEYWEMFYRFDYKKQEISAKLERYKNEKIKLSTKEDVLHVVDQLKAHYIVCDIQKKTRERAAKPPFITSTLQQEASSKYNYHAKRTMMIAQRLYEGVELENERVGLITYMRTDSMRLADEFVQAGKQYILKEYGEKYYKGYQNKGKPAKNVQDAHEAIRPSNIAYTPQKVKPYLTGEEWKLYTLIYDRALSSLMSNAVIEDEKVIIDNNDYQFEANGEKVIFPGYSILYGKYENNSSPTLPDFTVNQEITNGRIDYEQKYTKAPLRYSEARLIRKLEELGIGRPSTYSTTLETLKIRNYAKLEQKVFIPTKQGRLTTEKLDEFFPAIINYDYTAKMEETLDDISEGNKVSHEELKTFYDFFAPMVEHAELTMEKTYPVILDEVCPECGKPLVIRIGRFGEFTACSGFPTCRYIKKEEKAPPVSTGITCPVCKTGNIVEREKKRGRGKGTKFYACDRYPTCKTTFSSLEEITNKE